MPLSGCRQKASGVSSTSTVRAMSRPSRDRSLMHGYLWRSSHAVVDILTLQKGPLMPFGSIHATDQRILFTRQDCWWGSREYSQWAGDGGRPVQPPSEAVVLLLQAVGDGRCVVLHARREEDHLCKQQRWYALRWLTIQSVSTCNWSMQRLMCT